MFAIRRARRSVFEQLKTMFTDTSIWTPAFTVYELDDLALDAAALTKPFLYILDSRILFETRHLPVIVIEAEFEILPYQLGTKPRGLCSLELHIFGNSRGQRDDLSGSIIDHVESIVIKDFDTTGWPTLATEELIPDQGGRYWTLSHPDISTEVAIEGSLANWDMLETQFFVDVHS